MRGNAWHDRVSRFLVTLGCILVGAMLAQVLGAGCEKAHAATVTFGSPYQRAGDTAWWVPVLLREFDGGNLQCVDFRVKRTGTIEPRFGNSEVVGSLEHGNYWPEMQGIVQTTFPASPDSFSVSACKSTFGCTNEGPEGWLFSVRVEGVGTIALGEDFRLLDCDNALWTLPRTVLSWPVQIPPEKPIPTTRSTWGRVKGVWR